MRAFGVGALVWTLAASAHAAPASDPGAKYSLAWVRDDGAEACPAGRDFREEVTRRLGHSPFDERAERAIEIRVERDATAYRSRVVVRERDGRAVGQRVLSSPGDCGALFSATALAVALLIDPEATLHADANASEAVAKFDVLEPKPGPSRPPAPPPATAPPQPPAAPSPSVESPPLYHLDAGGASARAAIGIGIVPGVVPGAELLVRKRAGRHLGWAATALYLASGDAASQGTTFDVGLTAFSLSGLFELIDESDAFVAGAEIGAWAGALRTAVETPPPSNGTTVTATDPGDFLFLALDLGFHVRAKLAGPIFLEARALALAPLIRRRLEVQASPAGPSSPSNNTVVWLQPLVGALGTLGVSVPFP